MKYTYQRKYHKIIDIIMSCERSECIHTGEESVVPERNSERYNELRRELTDVLVEFTTPEIKFFGVSEIYEINYILNKYGLMFKRSLYRLFITVAIIDSIGTRLGGEMSYMQHMADIVVEMFNIKIDEPDTDEDEGEEEEDDDDAETE